MCGEPGSVKYSFIQGRPAVDNGDICGLDEAELTARVQESVAQLIRGRLASLVSCQSLTSLRFSQQRR